MEDESLSEIIERAGGFTPDAYLAAAVFSRVSVRQRERQRMQEYAMEMERNILQLSGELAVTDNPEEAQAVLKQQQAVAQQLRTAQPVGRVVLDLTNPASYAGFVMKDGDSLHVPRDLSTVSVVGEVYNPSTFKLDGAGRTAGHYVQLAGGFKERADRKNVYIVKANGSIRTRKMADVSKETLHPGDAVIVPQKLRYVSASRVFAETISTLVNVTAIFTSIATLILVAR